MRPVTIHLCGLPEGVQLPGRTGRPCPLLGLAPGGVYRADDVAVAAGALLPHRFTLTCDRSAEATRPIGGLSLLHLSVRSPRPGSRQHPALWSPDFPRRCSTHRRGHPATSPLRGEVYDRVERLHAGPRSERFVHRRDDAPSERVRRGVCHVRPSGATATEQVRRDRNDRRP
jgi:hypothetical protein